MALKTGLDFTPIHYMPLPITVDFRPLYVPLQSLNLPSLRAEGIERTGSPLAIGPALFKAVALIALREHSFFSG